MAAVGFIGFGGARQISIMHRTGKTPLVSRRFSR
jgi:hypothetical protein